MDVQAQFRDRQRRDINPVKMQGKVISCHVPPDDQLPPVASAVLGGLGSESLLAYRLVYYLLLKLPIYMDLNAFLQQFEFDIHVACVFVLKPEA